MEAINIGGPGARRQQDKSSGELEAAHVNAPKTSVREPLAVELADYGVGHAAAAANSASRGSPHHATTG